MRNGGRDRAEHMILDPNYRVMMERLLKNHIRSGAHTFHMMAVVVLADYITESCLKAREDGLEKEADLALSEILRDHMKIYMDGQFDYVSVPWPTIFRDRMREVLGDDLFYAVENNPDDPDNTPEYIAARDAELERFARWVDNFQIWCESGGKKGVRPGPNNGTKYTSEFVDEFSENNHKRHASLVEAWDRFKARVESEIQV